MEINLFQVARAQMCFKCHLLKCLVTTSTLTSYCRLLSLSLSTFSPIVSLMEVYLFSTFFICIGVGSCCLFRRGLKCNVLVQSLDKNVPSKCSSAKSIFFFQSQIIFFPPEDWYSVLITTKLIFLFRIYVQQRVFVIQ